MSFLLGVLVVALVVTAGCAYLANEIDKSWP